MAGFDIVIGNPPYVSAPTQIANFALCQQRKNLINSGLYKTLYQKWDLYVPFMEFGCKVLAQNGVFSMIVPYPITNQLYGKVFRQWLLAHYDVPEIVDLNGTKIFDNVNVSNIILFAQNKVSTGESIISHIDEQKHINHAFIQSHQQLVQDEKTQVWNLTKQERKANRHADMHTLGDFCYISVGMVLNADEKTAKGAFKKEDLISPTADTIHCRKYIEAKDIDRYQIKRVRYLEYDTERVPNQLRRPTFRELYDREKLIFNSIGTLKGYYDIAQMLHNHSLTACVLWKNLRGVNNKSISNVVKKISGNSRVEMETLSESISLLYVLGIMNSKYAGILLDRIRGGYINIYPEHIRNIPIPPATSAQQQEIIALVNEILAAKAANPQADTTALEKQIDQLVYALYHLTPQEISLVEGNN